MSHPFDLDTFAADHAKPLQLVHRVRDHSSDQSTLTLTCETLRFQRSNRDRYGTTLETAEAVGRGPDVTIRVRVYTPYVMRFQMVVGDPALLETKTPMVLPEFFERQTPVQFMLSDDTIDFTTEALQVSIFRDPWHLHIRDSNGDRLWETVPAAIFQHPPTGMASINGSAMPDAWPWFFRSILPLGFVQDDVSGQIQSFETAYADHDEHFYGFGENFSSLNKRGQSVNLWHENALGNSRPSVYKNVPFYMSSRGYGHFVNTAYPIQYHLGDQSYSHVSIQAQTRHLDYFLIAGKAYRDILPRYTDITGKPGLPPLWSFGLWMSRMSYEAQDQVEQIADRLRAEEIPCDVIHIDTDWFEKPWINDLTFSPTAFPDPPAMIRYLRERGYRLSLWQIPYISTGSKFYPHAREQGYFAQRTDGSPYHIEGFFGKAGVIDYSNPDAAAWMRRQFEPLFNMGISVIKTDFGEGAPPDATYAEADGLEMHNLYPLLYTKAIYDETLQQTGEGIVWSRSAYAGVQRYPVHWAGDSAVLWEEMAHAWRGGLSLGLSGFPFWSVDIGGFAGTPSSDLYIRWAQAGLFVSHPRAHGPIAREPWHFGEEALRLFRYYAQLRYALMPYVWSMAQVCVNASLPFLRPLLIDWQDDPTTAYIDDQYLFGEWLMIAPILDRADRRQVYIPSGTWFDYWTDEVFEGPMWITIEASLGRLPLFVRGGAMIPSLTKNAQHTGDQDWSQMTVDVYPVGRSEFRFFEEEQATDWVCEIQNHGIHLALGSLEKYYTLRFHGGFSGIKSVQINNVVLKDQRGGKVPGWTVDANNRLIIQFQSEITEETRLQIDIDPTE